MTKIDSKLLTDFGEAVNRARSLRGWTLDQLAAELGSGHKSYLSNIEKGRRDTVSRRTVGRLIKALDLDENWIDRFPANSSNDDPTPAENAADNLVARAQADTEAPPTGEELLVELATRFVGAATGDLKDIYNDLRGALEAAADLKRRAELPSNLDAQVRATLAEVTRLNDLNQLDAAQAQIDAGLARLTDEIAERQQAAMALHDAAIDQARLRNAPDTAARHILARLALDAPADPFDALRAEMQCWWETGRDKGRAFDLAVSIALARATLARAKDPDQRGTALNDLGTALSTLGEREPGTETLAEAVTAYRAALEERTRDRVPLDWAMTQNNLGNALSTLGTREPGTETLAEAVTAYRAALEEYTRDRVPLDWAMIQNNLGATLRALGTREPGTETLTKSVAAFRAALEERTRDRVPFDWAGTNLNLAVAELALHAHAPDPAFLAGARARVIAAREVFAIGAPFYAERADKLLAMIDTAAGG